MPSEGPASRLAPFFHALVRIRNWLWGYDFFISYHWNSGGSYAVNLAQRLRDKKYDVFLDRAEYAMGDDWLREGRSSLFNTKRLILVATPEAISISEPVLKEVAAFTSRSRLIVPVVFDETISEQTRANSPVLQLIPPTTLYLAERPEQLALGPSDNVLQQLQRTHAVLRRRSLRAILMVVVFVALLIATIVTAWQRRDAILSRDSLAGQLASAEFERAQQVSTSDNPRASFLHLLRAATIAPAGDPRRETYLDATILKLPELPNRLVNLETMKYEPVQGVLSADLRFFLAITTRFRVEGWDLQSGQRLSIPDTSSIAGYGGDSVIGDDRGIGMGSLAISPNSKLALALLNGKQFGHFRLVVWELETGRLVSSKDEIEGDWLFAFREDSRAVLMTGTQFYGELPPNAPPQWEVAWSEVPVEANSANTTAPAAKSKLRQVIICQGNRPLDVVAEPMPEDDSSPIVVKDASVSRPSGWIAAAKSSDGKTLALVSRVGFATFWKRSPHPFVSRATHAGNRTGLVTSSGHSIVLSGDGTLTRSSITGPSQAVKIREDQPTHVDDAILRLSPDGKRLVLWFCGTGPKGDYDYCGGIQLRDATTLKLIVAQQEPAVPYNPDDYVREIAWLGGESDEVVFAQGNADSDYFRIRRESMRAEKWNYSDRVKQIPRSEFAALTLDGQWIITSRESERELLFCPTGKQPQPDVGPFRIMDMVWLLRRTFNLKFDDDNITGELDCGAEFSLVDDPTGAQLFLNGRRVNGDGGLIMSRDGQRWAGSRGHTTSAGPFGTERILSLIDAPTGFLLGNFPIPDMKRDGLRFLDDSQVISGCTSDCIFHVTAGFQLRSPPLWFAKIGEATCGLVLDEQRNLRTLSPTEHAAARQQFLAALTNAAKSDCHLAAKLLEYFRDGNENQE